MNGTLQRRDPYPLRPARTQKSTSYILMETIPRRWAWTQPSSPRTLRNQCGLLTWSAVLGYSTWNRLRDVPHRTEGGHAEAGGGWEKTWSRRALPLCRQAGTLQGETGHVYDSNVTGQQMEAWSLSATNAPRQLLACTLEMVTRSYCCD